MNPDQAIGKQALLSTSGRSSGMRNNHNNTTVPYLRKGYGNDRSVEKLEALTVRHPELSKKTYF